MPIYQNRAANLYSFCNPHNLDKDKIKINRNKAYKQLITNNIQTEKK